MQAGRATTGNYYGALRTDASDGTAETDIPDPDPEALRSEDSPLHHLPSEVLAVVLQYLTTAAPFLWCNSGDRLRLTRMTRRLDGLCEAMVSAAAAPRSRPAQDLLVLPAAGRPRAVLDLWGAARVILLPIPTKIWATYATAPTSSSVAAVSWHRRLPGFSCRQASSPRPCARAPYG